MGQALRFVADYHTHTGHSHGRGTIEDNVRAAAMAGLSEVAITDHGPANLFGVGVSGLDELLEIREEIERLRRRYRGMRILWGVEANVLDELGSLDVPDGLLAKMDIVLIGLHRLVRPSFTVGSISLVAGNLFASARPWFRDRMQSINTLALMRAVERRPVDIIAHPGAGVPVDLTQLAIHCARYGTSLEINTRHGLPTASSVRSILQHGASLVVSSDAHCPGQVGNMGQAGELLGKMGVSAAIVINASE